MSSDEDAPQAISFSNAKINAVASFKQSRQNGMDNKRKRKRKRGGTDGEKKNSTETKTRRLNCEDNEMEVTEGGGTMETEENSLLEDHCTTFDKLSDTDEGYNGSEESCSLPERTSVRLVDESCNRLMEDALRFRDQLLHGKRQVRRINMRRWIRDKHKMTYRL